MVQIDICESVRQTQTGMCREGLQNLDGPAMNIIWPKRQKMEKQDLCIQSQILGKDL